MKSRRSDGAGGLSQIIESLPFLDPPRPGYSVRSEEVLAARQENWCARTPHGLAVLRYPRMKELILHPGLRQGSFRRPDHNDERGLWSQWWKRIMFNVEGKDQLRLRRLAQPYSPGACQDLREELLSPQFDSRNTIARLRKPP